MASQLRPFTRVLNADDMHAGATENDVEVPAGKYTKIAYFQVPAQQQIALGSGEIANGVDSREYVQVRFDSASGQIGGKVRIGYTNANETNVQIVKEERTDNIGTASTVKLGEVKNLRAMEDSYLVIYFNPDSSTTIDYSDSDNKILLPVVVYQ